MFLAEKEIQPVSAYTSIGTVVKKCNLGAFEEVPPFLPDVLKLEDMVVRHWEAMRDKGSDKFSITRA